MSQPSRRALLAGAALVTGTAMAQSRDGAPAPIEGNRGAPILGPRNPQREAQGPDLLAPPPTDHGGLPNLRFSFSDAHVKMSVGGWSRQVTERELAEQLEVSQRTIHRDLEALSAARIPVSAMRGAQGGWQLEKGWRTQVPSLDEAELRALLMRTAPAFSSRPKGEEDGAGLVDPVGALKALGLVSVSDVPNTNGASATGLRRTGSDRLHPRRRTPGALRCRAPVPAATPPALPTPLPARPPTATAVNTRVVSS